MRVLGALLTGLCLWPAVARAQTSPEPSRIEIQAVGAVPILWDDESKVGLGVAGGAGIGYRWHGRLGVEARVEGFSNSRTFSSGVKFKATGTRVLGQVIYYWSDDKVQPFAGGTFGIMKVKQRNEFPVVTPGPTGPPIVIGTDVFEGRDTDRVWGGSGGVRIRVTDRFALRPEAGLLFSMPNNFIDIRFGVTASVSW